MDARRSHLLSRRSVLATTFAVAATMGWTPGIASAWARQTDMPAHTASTKSASHMSLAQAPRALQEAVRATLGGPSVPGTSALNPTELTASDGASGDTFGSSVSLSGSTAVIGAPHQGSNTGTVYVFVSSKKTWTQQAELTASDGAPGDLFGSSVALDGSTLVVGAAGKGSNTGAAYVFTGSGQIWSQEADVSASDGAAGDGFGASVAVYGSLAIVGAGGASSGTGAAYVFVDANQTWSQEAKLAASDGAAGDDFGASVAIIASIALIGAPGQNSASGAAYVFVRSKKTWSQQTKLTATGGAPGDGFGVSIAFLGSTAVVGASGAGSTGAAYVFTHVKKSWAQQAELTASDGAAGDLFGASVAMGGSAVVLGAPGRTSGSGAAYVFVGSNATWSPETEVTAADGAPGDLFGSSVAVTGSTAMSGAPGRNASTGSVYASALPIQRAELGAPAGVSGDQFGYSVAVFGSTAVVGAPGTNGAAGATYVFVSSKNAWTQQAVLTASDGAPGDGFGVSVAVSGSTAVVGADGVKASTGAAYVFVRSKGIWSQQAKLTASDGLAGDQFGCSVTIDGDFAIVGAQRRSASAGGAYVFVTSDGIWSELSVLNASHGAAGDLFGSSASISGGTAVIGASGRRSGAGAAYVFLGSWTIWFQSALITASDGLPGDHFGASVALDGTTALIAAPARASSAGAVYVFVPGKKTWTQEAELAAPGGAAGDFFGSSVALAGTVAVVGADGTASGSGAAFVFAGSGPNWSVEARLAPSDAAPGDLFGYSVAISGLTAVMGANGKGSATGAAYAYGLAKA